MFKEFSLGCLVVGCSLIRKKEKLAEIATRCHSLSLVVPLVVIRCHSLPLVVSLDVTRSHSMYHSSVFYKRSIESALIEHKVYPKTDFSRNSHHEETSNFICIANHLTGVRIIQVSTERNFRSEL